MKKLLSLIVLSFTAAAILPATGCSTAPKTEGGKQALGIEVNEAVDNFRHVDSSLASKMDKAYGYAVFPSVGKGGAGLGGAYGKGVVFEQGKKIGYCDLSQGTIGAQLGGQKYSELILFENKGSLDRFKDNKFEVAAQASAVAASSGAAANAKYTNGVLVFVTGAEGLMAEASIGGQRFTYKPM